MRAWPAAPSARCVASLTRRLMVPMDVVISSAELATVWTLELAWLAAVATALALAVVSLAASDSVSALLFKRTADDATLRDIDASQLAFSAGRYVDALAPTERLTQKLPGQAMYLDRLARVRKAMADKGVDTLLLSVGHDLPYLTGYQAMPLERLTMLLLSSRGAAIVVPRL